MSSPLDREFLDELLDGDLEFGGELFETFEEASIAWVEEARTACQSGDVERAARAFHTLKGSAAAVGLTQLCEVARQFELWAKEGQVCECAQRLPELESQLRHGQALLTEFLRSG